MMPPTKTRHEVEILLLCLLGQLNDFPDAGGIDGHGFFEETMNAFFYGIGQMLRAESRGRG